MRRQQRQKLQGVGLGLQCVVVVLVVLNARNLGPELASFETTWAHCSAAARSSVPGPRGEWATDRVETSSEGASACQPSSPRAPHPSPMVGGG